MRATMCRLGVVALAAGAAVLFVAGPAAAHVTVNPSQATQGGFAKLAFRVPNEKDSASTVKLEVAVPTDTPIAALSVRPVAGWTAVVQTATLPTPVKTDGGEVTDAVSRITWTATSADSAIGAGQFQEFEVSAGPLPKADQIVFKVLQTYSDGDIVRWIDEPEANGAEPEHPAPVLKLAKSADASAAAATSQAGSGTGDRSGWALGVGIAALVVALGALGVALSGWRPGTRPTSSS